MSNNNPSKGVITINLTKGYTAIISAENASLESLKWSALVGRNGHVYAHRSIPGRKKEYLGRRVLEEILKRELIKGESCTHIDKNSLNNTRENITLKVSKSLQAEREKLKTF